MTRVLQVLTILLVVLSARSGLAPRHGLAQGLAPEPETPSSRAPSALVEEIQSEDRSIGEMDYLAPGQIVHLAAEGRLVLDYTESCVRETIAGGVVMIGAEQSRIIGGTVAREHLPCGAGKLQLTAQQAAQSGGVVFRNVPSGQVQIERMLHSLSPVIDLHGATRLVVERLDQAEPRIEIDAAATDLLRGTFYDFARASRRLVPGGIYRANAGDSSVVFRVDPEAKPDGAPLLSRLLRP